MMNGTEYRRAGQSRLVAITFTLIAFLFLTRQRPDSQKETSSTKIHTTNSGNVGIGTTSPVLRLESKGTAGLPATSGTSQTGITRLSQASGSGVIDFGFGGASGYGWLQATDSSNLATNYGLLLNPNGGNVGIGTASPNYPLVIGAPFPNGLVFATATISRGAGQSASVVVGSSGGSAIEFGWDQSNTRGFVNAPGTSPFAFTQDGINVRLYVSPAGNIGIGTTTPSTPLHVVGNATIAGDVSVTGNISARYQDVAEWVPSRQQLTAGTVVVLDTTVSNQVTASSSAYDTRLAGVVSAQPGLILGEAGEGRVMVATVGRVRVRVDATRAPIRVGDLLVTSEREGYAMRSEPVSFGGVSMHRPGTLLGRALEPLASGTGEILVLLSLQ